MGSDQSMPVGVAVGLAAADLALAGVAVTIQRATVALLAAKQTRQSPKFQNFQTKILAYSQDFAHSSHQIRLLEPACWRKGLRYYRRFQILGHHQTDLHSDLWGCYQLHHRRKVSIVALG